MTDIIHIPLNKLIAWEGNVRRTMTDEGIEALAASIQAHTLIQPLVVRKAPGKGQNYHVVAGGRRLRAMQLNAERKHMKLSDPVRCYVLPANADATAISLAENTVRENMHPADEFEAFRDLIDQGKSIEAVAAAFGVTPHVVKRRLKLANVSPKVLQAYRDEEIDLDMIMAFAVSDDHDAQDNLLAELKPWQGADDIRNALTVDDIPTTDKSVKFVGVKAYEKAGGTFKRDLFSEEGQGLYIEDTALLATLVTAKGDKAAAKLKKEGWKWTEFREDLDYEARSKFRQVYPEQAPLSPEQEAEVNTLEAEHDQLEDVWNNDPDEDAPYPERCREIAERLDAIENDRDESFTPEQLSYAGAVVTIDYDGKPAIWRGLVKPEDMPKPAGKAKAAQSGSTHAAAEQSPALSAALTERLTAQKSAAIAASLMEKPSTALAMVVYTMALTVFDHHMQSCLHLSASKRSLASVEGSKAFDKLESARENWGHTIPGQPDALWSWCMTQDEGTLLDLLAFCTACTVDAVQRKHDPDQHYRLLNAELLAAEVKLDMAEWFTPTAENYFSKIGKPQIIEALQEAGASLPAATMKKGDMATFAEAQLAGKGWVPEILRLPA